MSASMLTPLLAVGVVDFPPLRLKCLRFNRQWGHTKTSPSIPPPKGINPRENYIQTLLLCALRRTGTLLMWLVTDGTMFSKIPLNAKWPFIFFNGQSSPKHCLNQQCFSLPSHFFCVCAFCLFKSLLFSLNCSSGRPCPQTQISLRRCQEF